MSTLTIHIAEPASLSLFRHTPVETVWLSVSPAWEAPRREAVRPQPARPVTCEMELFEEEPERWDGLS